MSYKLFLDDYRKPPDVDWIVVSNYQQFVEKIEKDGLPYYISFDHDLADVHYPHSDKENSESNTIDYSSERYSKEKTGYHCALWLIEYCDKNKLMLPDWSVHSMNPVGRVNISQLLHNYQQKQFKGR